MVQTASDSFHLALKHLARVEVAWLEPTDWTDLATYGFYCLEACVVAAVLHLGGQRPDNHRDKVDAARQLASTQGLPDVGDLLVDLNAMRSTRHTATPNLPRIWTRTDVAISIDEFVESVRRLLTP